MAAFPLLCLLAVVAQVAYAQNPCARKQCGPGEECRLQQVQCIRAPCPPIAVCENVTEGDTNCAAVSCPRGSVCVMEQVQCFAPPCNPIPRCVRPGRANRSAVLSCATLACPRGQVCKQEKGPAKCVSVDEEPGPRITCANVRCAGPCVMVQVQCFAPPCYPVPQCQPPPGDRVTRSVEDNSTIPHLTCANVRCRRECKMLEVECSTPPCRLTPVCVDPEKPGCMVVRCNAETHCVLNAEGNGICVPNSECSLPCAPGTECVYKDGIEQCVVQSVPKPGEICALTDCASGLICRERQVLCIRAPCPPIAECVAPEQASCAARSCEAGTKCEMVQVQCIRAPCPPLPVCLPTDDKKPLKCGNEDKPCGDGLACVYEEVLCKKAPCPPRSHCVPVKPLLTCESYDCMPGFYCTMEQVQCIRAPCPTRPRCLPAEPAPGEVCARTTCDAGLVCKETQVQCFVAPCPPIAECVAPSDIVNINISLDKRSAASCAVVLCLEGTLCVESDGRVDCVPVDPREVPEPSPCDLACVAGHECQIVDGSPKCVMLTVPPLLTCATVNCVSGMHCEMQKGRPACVSCGEHETFDACFAGCEETCDDQGPKACPAICKLDGGCRCDSGFIRRPSDARCVKREQCNDPPKKGEECPAGERFYECAPCDDECGRAVLCPASCRKGCACLPGHVRDPSKNGRCVLEAECASTGAPPLSSPAPSSPRHAVPRDVPSTTSSAATTCSAPGELFYDECKPCDQICGHEPMGCPAVCFPGCACAPGHVRDPSRPGCIPQEACVSTTPTPTVCPSGEQFYEACAPCDQRCGREPVACVLSCTSGCRCSPGHVRDPAMGNRCVLEPYCSVSATPGPGTQPSPRPVTRCAAGEMFYRGCKPCDQPCGNEQMPCEEICQQGCACRPGHRRVGRRCIPSHQCDRVNTTTMTA